MIRFYVDNRINPISKTTKYFASPTSPEPITFDQIAKRINDATTFTPSDVIAVLTALEKELIKNLQEGRSVRFKKLGSFHCTLHSMGSDTHENFKISNLRSLSPRFVPSTRLRSALLATNPNIRFLQVDAPVNSPQPPEKI